MDDGFRFSLLKRPTIMGIVNITPNSFSDTGRHFDPAVACDHAAQLAAAGAQIVDLGAEASSFFRVGVAPVDVAEQLRRLRPVLMQLPAMRDYYISIDTRSSEVAREAITLGAQIINDISSGTHDPEMLATVAMSGAAIILMHISPCFPENASQDDPDILAAVRTYLADRIAAARIAGIPQDKIAIDPGLGFGKTAHDNWALALRAHELAAALHAPVVLGPSRKRFLESAPPTRLLAANRWSSLLASAESRIENHKSRIAVPVHPRDAATAALTELAIQNGIPIHRLHNPVCFR